MRTKASKKNRRPQRVNDPEGTKRNIVDVGGLAPVAEARP